MPVLAKNYEDNDDGEGYASSSHSSIVATIFVPKELSGRKHVEVFEEFFRVVAGLFHCFAYQIHSNICSRINKNVT